MENPTLPTLNLDLIQQRIQINSSFTHRSKIKFAIIGKESLPYLSQPATKRDQLYRGFTKNELKQNRSFNTITINHKLLRKADPAETEQKRKKKLKMEKLCNIRNFEQHKLRKRYENLRINSIIEEASRQLIEKQNILLKGMM